MEKTFIEWLQHFNFKPNLYDRYHKAMIDKLENESVFFKPIMVLDEEKELGFWTGVKQGLTSGFEFK